MLTNKDIRVENGNIVINGDKYPLDGQSPEAIMAIVKDNSDTTPTENSDAPITSGGVYTALGTKQDTLTFDTTPTAESTNPVTSGGVKNYVDGKSFNLTSSSFDIASALPVGKSAAVIISDSSLCTAFSDDLNSLSGVVSRLTDTVFAWNLATLNNKFIYVRTNATYTVSKRFYAAGTEF